MFHRTQISESGSYAELLAKRGDFSDFIVEQLQGTEEETDEEEVKEVVNMISLCFFVLYLESSILTFIPMKKMHKMVFTHSKVWKTLEQSYGKEELESKKEQASKGGQKNIHQCIYPFA